MSYRDWIRQKLISVRPDLDLRSGTPMNIFLVDPLALITGPIEDDIDSLREMTADTVAANWLVTRDAGEDSVFVVRILFYNPVSLKFSRGGMLFKTDDGVMFTNTTDVSITDSSMSLYVDGGYYYYDLNISGSGVYRDNMTFTWDNDPTDELASIVIRSVSQGGSLPETNDQLLQRVADISTLRSPVTRKGAEALLKDQFGAKVRDVFSVGFKDDLMQRDIIEDIHVGGCMDIYTKGDLPNLTQTQVEVDIMEDRTVDGEVTLLFLEDFIDRFQHHNLTSYSAIGWARSTTFVEGIHYDMDALTGTVTMYPPPTPASTDYIQRFSVAGVSVTGPMEVTVPGVMTFRIFPGSIMKFDTVDDYFFVSSVTIVAGDTVIALDHNVGTPVFVDTMFFEPVRFTYEYHPIGTELVNLENPVVRMDEIYVLDPMTGEETTTEVPRLPGYGAGVYGGGPYGYGSEAGWKLSVDDVNLRYSMEESGFFEIPVEFIAEAISMNYAYAQDTEAFQTAMDESRALAASQLVKAFLPVNTYMSLDVEAPEVPQGMEQYLWGISAEVDISDIINQLYTLGATEVDINDLMVDTIFELWDIDGTFVSLSPTPEGRLTLSNNSMRLYPADVEIRLK